MKEKLNKKTHKQEKSINSPEICEISPEGARYLWSVRFAKKVFEAGMEE